MSNFPAAELTQASLFGFMLLVLVAVAARHPGIKSIGWWLVVAGLGALVAGALLGVLRGATGGELPVRAAELGLTFGGLVAAGAGLLRWNPVLRYVSMYQKMLEESEEARAAARDSEARLRLAFDAGKTGGWEVDLETGKLLWSEGVQDLLGQPGKKAGGVRPEFAKTVHPEDASRAQATVSDALEGGTDYHAEFRVIWPDDEAVHWLASRGHFVEDSETGRKRLLGALIDITDTKAAEEALQHQADHDSLTGLPNRLLFSRRLDASIARTPDEAMSVLLLDLDRFKEVNDTFGHPLGDHLLREVARRLRRTVRDTDIVARLGGDEFAILLPATNPLGSSVAATKVLQEFDEPFVIQGKTLRIGTSIGIASYPRHASDSAGIMRLADVAMYVAKRTNSGYSVYRVDLDEHTPAKLALESDLRTGIDRGELRLDFQPKIEIKTRKLIGFEALVRWQHPERGLLAPDEFISLSERTSLIIPLTSWVLDTALKACCRWRIAGYDVGVAVNVSADSVQSVRLPDQIAGLLESNYVPPRSLELEITESVLMDNPAHALDVVSRLSGMGIRVSIDDFGSGYSSLAYLKRLPVDAIKIDKAFVLNMSTDADDASIVRSTIELGHNLGMKVIAEGVENIEVWDLLASGGCDIAQGYYMSRPIPSDDVLAWLQEQTEYAVDLVSRQSKVA